MRKVLVLLRVLGFVKGSALADPEGLEGGVLIAHFPTEMEFSSEPPTGGWCQDYWDNYRIEDCEDQVIRIDTYDQVIWFVLAAWDEEKEWCGTEFGLGDYDPAAFVITDYGPCWPEGGLEIPTASWPGPEEGTAIVVTGEPWEGNLVPVYWFAGYAYEEGLIPLAVDPATGFAGTANCASPPETWAADSLGGMGLFQDGVYACPEGFMLGGQGSGPQGGGSFEPQTGNGEAIIVRFAPDVISFPQDDAGAPQYFKAPIGDAVLALPSLDSLLAEIGAESLATVAPGWRHLTPGRSLDFFGNPTDLVDFTDVYLVTLDGEMSAEDAIGELWGKAGIIYAEHEDELTFCEMPEAPNDPYYAEGCCGQWYLNNDAEGECGEDCVPDIDMNIPEAWAVCYNRDPPIKAGTKIGIMDHPVNQLHEDLGPFIDFSLAGSFVSGEWDNDPRSWGSGPHDSHGTGMASMAGAGTDNEVGIASIANVPGSHDDGILVPLVFFAGLPGTGNVFAAAAAVLDWICTNPLARGRIRVVNASWGNPRWKFCHDLGDSSLYCWPMTTLRDAWRNAFRTGVNLVASAGNGGNPGGGCAAACSDADTAFMYPAAFPDYSLAVAALGCRGQLHQEPGFHVGSYIDVAGPGVGVEQLGKVPTSYEDNYGCTGEGTSPASAAIASAVALLLGAQSDLYPEDCSALLKASAESYGHASFEVGAGMPRLDRALEWVSGEYRVFHGSQQGYTDIEIEEGWSVEEPHPVMLKNVPPELCEVGGGEHWQELNLVAYRLTSVVQIDPPEGGSIEMVWPRGVGSSGWRLLDQTFEGNPDPEVPPYYDVRYYENWSRLIGGTENPYTFVSYTYKVVLEGDDCWVPFDPATETYNVNYSYVVHDPNMLSSVENLPEARSLNLTVKNSPARPCGDALLEVSLPAPAQVWLGVYGVDGRLVRVILDRVRLEAGRTGVAWDMTGETSRPVPAGVYFVRAKARFAGTAPLVTRAQVVVVR